MRLYLSRKVIQGANLGEGLPLRFQALEVGRQGFAARLELRIVWQQALLQEGWRGSHLVLKLLREVFLHLAALGGGGRQGDARIFANSRRKLVEPVREEAVRELFFQFLSLFAQRGGRLLDAVIVLL